MLARFLQNTRQHTKPEIARAHMWRKAMVAFIVQLVIVSIWAAMLVIHTRRLFRLAQVESLTQWGERRLRPKLHRMWWWLGREEYWRAVQVDVLRCLQMTLMCFLLAWGVYS